MDIKQILKDHAAYLAGEPDGIYAYLLDANLRGASLRDANLRGASLRGADLRDASLRGADLRDASLRGASLRGASLRGANLQGANLQGANLQGADLRDADLRDADLRDADLRDANLSQSNGLPYSQCSFSGHGECGRMLTLVEIADEKVFFCGCFKGSPDELMGYIRNGKAEHFMSRKKAMDFCLNTIHG